MKYNVKSFNVDHRQIVAPGVSLSDVFHVGDSVITKYSIRLTKPNSDYIKPEAMHALEHITAIHIRDFIENVIDLSPMGCMTGFYLTVIGGENIPQVTDAIKACLKIASMADFIPAANEIECGNFRFMDINEMKKKAAEILRNWS